MKTPVEIAYEKYHKKFIEIVSTFGGLRETEVEDIVQQLYIELIKYQQRGVDFSYGDDINYYFCYKILRGLYIDLIRKKCKVKLIELEGLELTENNSSNYEAAYKKVKDALDTMFWYDKQVYELIEQGNNISELSRKTKISYYSLYNTYTKVKNKLKELI